jgi:hypothetical protein
MTAAIMPIMANTPRTMATDGRSRFDVIPVAGSEALLVAIALEEETDAEEGETVSGKVVAVGSCDGAKELGGEGKDADVTIGITVEGAEVEAGCATDKGLDNDNESDDAALSEAVARGVTMGSCVARRLAANGMDGDWLASATNGVCNP